MAHLILLILALATTQKLTCAFPTASEKNISLILPSSNPDALPHPRSYAVIYSREDDLAKKLNSNSSQIQPNTDEEIESNCEITDDSKNRIPVEEIVYSVTVRKYFTEPHTKKHIIKRVKKDTTSINHHGNGPKENDKNTNSGKDSSTISPNKQ